MRLLIHPGFHKTGTTTLQRTLAAHRAMLVGRLDFRLPGDTEELALRTRRYAIKPQEGVAAQVATALRACLQRAPDRRDLPLLISNEALCGILPGRKGVWDYHAAPTILRLLVATAQLDYPDAEISVLISTRDTESWMRSVYWQNLRSSRITEDFLDFRLRLGAGLTLEQTVAGIRAAVPTSTNVLEVDATARQDPLGVLGVALDHLAVDRTGITLLWNQNVQPPDGIATLLHLNRSDLPEDQIAVEKRKFLDSIKRRRSDH